MILDGIFGNKSAGRVLLHIYHYGEVHASAIAKDNRVALTPIICQLNRFERVGLLSSKTAGRSRLYFFNPKSPLTRPVSDILEIAYRAIPVQKRQERFRARRRPRQKGKPIL